MADISTSNDISTDLLLLQVQVVFHTGTSHVFLNRPVVVTGTSCFSYRNW